MGGGGDFDPSVKQVNNIVYVNIGNHQPPFQFDKNGKEKEFSLGIWTVFLKEGRDTIIVKKEENSHTFFANKKMTKTWKFVATNTDAFRVEKSKTEVLNTAGYGTYAIFLSACVLTWYLTRETKE